MLELTDPMYPKLPSIAALQFSNHDILSLHQLNPSKASGKIIYFLIYLLHVKRKVLLLLMIFHSNIKCHHSGFILTGTSLLKIDDRTLTSNCCQYML